MTTYFITLRHPTGREEFRSCKRDTLSAATEEAARLASSFDPPAVVVSVAPLRGALKTLGKSTT